MRTGSFGRNLAIAVGAAFLMLAGAATALILDTNQSLWSTLESASLYQRYARDNPNESARVKNYWLNGGAKPSVATSFGRFLVEVSEDRAPTTTQPPTTTPPTTTEPPPAGNTLLLSGTMTASVFQQKVGAAPSGALTVRPAAGQPSFTVTGEVTLTRANVTVQHGNFADFLIEGSADNTTVEDSHLLSFYARQGGVNNLLLQRNMFDGEYRVNQNWMYDATNFRILNNTFRRYDDQSDPNNHSEAIFVASGNRNGLIQGNTFDNNGRTGHLFFSWWGGSDSDSATWPRDICVKGNRFTNTHGAYDIQYRQEFPSSWPLYIEPPPSNTWSTVNGGSSFPTKACP